MADASFRERLRSRDTVTGVYSFLCQDPQWAEVYVRAGIDFAIMSDVEMPWTEDTMRRLNAALKASGIAALYRTAATDEVAARRFFALGATGVLVPVPDELGSLDALLESVHLDPLVGKTLAAARQGSAAASLRDRVREQNRERCVLVTIESEFDVSSLREVLEFDDVDGVFVDLRRLKLSPSICEDPAALATAVAEILVVCSKAGKAASIWPASGSQLRAYRDAGASMVTLRSDVRALQAGLAENLKQL